MGNPYASKSNKTVVTETAPLVPVMNPTPKVQEETVPEFHTQDFEPGVTSVGVSEMSVSAVLDVVGDDKELAALALAEEVAGSNRKTLVPRLEEIVNG